MTDAVGEPSKDLPTHAVEVLLCSVWGEYFGHPVDPDDDFFDLGGDSLAVLDIVLAARGHGLTLRASQALRYSTPARLAEAVTIRGAGRVPERLLAEVTAAAEDARRDGAPPVDRHVAEPAQPAGGGGGAAESPLFVVHSDSHRVAEHEALLRWRLGRPVRGLRLPGLRGTVTDGAGVVRAAAGVAEAVRARQPAGPVALAGFGLGAVFAFEAARALREAGERVGLLALVSPALPGVAVPHHGALLAERLAALGARFGLGDEDGAGELLLQARAAGWFQDVGSPAELAGVLAAWAELTSAVAGHRLEDFDGPALLAADGAALAAAEKVWRPALADVRVCRLDHGLDSPAGALRDPSLAEALRGGCAL